MTFCFHRAIVVFWVTSGIPGIGAIITHNLITGGHLTESPLSNKAKRIHAIGQPIAFAAWNYCVVYKSGRWLCRKIAARIKSKKDDNTNQQEQDPTNPLDTVQESTPEQLEQSSTIALISNDITDGPSSNNGQL